MNIQSYFSPPPLFTTSLPPSPIPAHFTVNTMSWVPPEAYQLVKACGVGLVHESPQSRTSLAHEIWKQLESKYKGGVWSAPLGFDRVVKMPSKWGLLA